MSARSLHVLHHEVNLHYAAQYLGKYPSAAQMLGEPPPRPHRPQRVRSGGGDAGNILVDSLGIRVRDLGTFYWPNDLGV